MTPHDRLLLRFHMIGATQTEALDAGRAIARLLAARCTCSSIEAEPYWKVSEQHVVRLDLAAGEVRLQELLDLLSPGGWTLRGDGGSWAVWNAAPGVQFAVEDVAFASLEALPEA